MVGGFEEGVEGVIMGKRWREKEREGDVRTRANGLTPGFIPVFVTARLREGKKKPLPLPSH